MEGFVARLQIVTQGVTERLAHVDAMRDAGDCESRAYIDGIRDLQQSNNQYDRLIEEAEGHIATLVKLIVEFRNRNPVSTEVAFRVAKNMVEWAGPLVTREQIGELIAVFPEMNLNPQAGTN
jgi:hypothetical protein